jgi:hypothetical protein
VLKPFDEARHIASNIAKRPHLLGKGADGVGFGRRPFTQSTLFLALSYSPLAMREQARRGH